MAMEEKKSIAVFPHIHAKHWKKVALRKNRKGISAWQLTFIGIASILGAGYFLATASTIHETGVSVLLSYGVGIFVMWTIFATFAEMLARDPGHKGSALYYIEKYMGRAYGFIGSWLYWLAGILIMSSEVTGISIFTQKWLPLMPIWLLSTLFTLLAAGINLIGLKNYGKIEMFFAWIKIVALLLFIVLIAGMILTGAAKPNGMIVNRNDWFVQGPSGFLISLSLMFFTFGGIVATGIASAEVVDERVIPRAFNRLIALLGGLYLFGLIAVLAVNSFAVIVPVQSPFVTTLSRIGIPYSDHVLNAVIISAAFSTMTAAMFGVSHIMVTLSERGEAPGRLCCENKRGVPVRSLVITVAALSVSILASVFLSRETYEYLTTSAGVILMFLWTLIILAHGGFVRTQSNLILNKYVWQKTVSITIIVIAVLGTLLHPSHRISLLISVMLIFLVAGVYGVMKNRLRSRQNS